jgi:putative hydrolase of the HAD superfamily
MLDAPAPRFDAVLLDFGGTLDADGEPAVEQFHRAYRTAGGRRSGDEFDRVFRESDRQLAAHSGIARLGFRDSVEQQSRLIAALVSGNERVDASAMAGMVHAAACATAERNVRILEQLRDRGMRTALVSNFTGNLARCVAELGLAHVFDAIVDSAVVGVRKPDARIFTIALERLGVGPSRALMVGDNPYADIGGAAAAGIATCWLAPLARAVPEGCAPTFRIARLGELMDHLERGVYDARHTTRQCTG